MYIIKQWKTQAHSNTTQTFYSVYRGRGATGSRCQLTPLFQVWGPYMALDPHFLSCSLVPNL